MINRSFRRLWLAFKRHRLWAFFLWLMLGLVLVMGKVAIATSPPSPSIGLNDTPSIVFTEPAISSAQEALQQGAERYQAERFADAMAIWQQALEQFQAEDDLLNQALVEANLSLTAQKLGQWDTAKSYIDSSLDLLRGFDTTDRDNLYWDIYGKVMNDLGQLQWHQGHAEAAYETWKQSTDAFNQIDNAMAAIGSQLNQIKALQSLGLHYRATKALEKIKQSVSEQTDVRLKMVALQKLGNAQRHIGELNNSKKNLERSLNVSRLSSDRRRHQSSILLDLGNTEWALSQRFQAIGKTRDANDAYKRAMQRYQKAAEVTLSSFTSAKAQVNQLRLLVETHSFSKKPAANILQLDSDIRPTLKDLPLNRSTAYLNLNYVGSIIKFLERENHDSSNTDLLKSKQLESLIDFLDPLVNQSEELQDPRVKSYLLGQLGELYEKLHILDQSKVLHTKTQYWNLAETYTREALSLSKSIHAREIQYRWEWQLGRLQEIIDDQDCALVAYTAAYDSLKVVRRNLLSIDSDLQFSFRDNIEPIHRHLVDLLLHPEGVQKPDSKRIDMAIEVIDTLQLAELENFLRCNFAQESSEEKEEKLASPSELIEKLDPTAALIYPVILEDRLDVILKIPGKDPTAHSNIVSKESVEVTVKELRIAIEQQDPEKRLRQAEVLYSWLISPLESELQNNSNIKTLVFVLDGTLRNVPMSVLYDGKQYLMEKDYGLALVPSIKLFDLQASRSEQIRVLAAGISQEQEIDSREFGELKYVLNELDNIQETVSTELLINQDFTRDTLGQKVKSTDFSVVHLATHGEFSSDPENTYIVAYKDLLQTRDLDNLIRTETQDKSEYLDLLVLSACETASGDNRAMLGLSGMALRAGANSTISTLWQINDQSTAFLMQRFYEKLKDDGESKAMALHQAQKELFEYGYKSPSTWAPYILVGNWF